MTKILTANEFVKLLKQHMNLPDNITNIEITASARRCPVELKLTCWLDDEACNSVVEALRTYELTQVGERYCVSGPAPVPFNGGEDGEA